MTDFDISTMPPPYAPGGPNPRERGGGHHAGHAGEPCKNCDTVLQGEYCHACGQPGHLHRTAFAVFEDFIHGIAHLDGRTWKTLPRLVFQPGRLTREYIEGKRARYVPPMALFLFTIFTMFIMFALLGGPVKDAPAQTKAGIVKVNMSVADKAEARRDLQKELAKAEASGDKVGAQAIKNALNGFEVFEGGKDENFLDVLKQSMKNGKFNVRTGNAKWDEKIKHKMENPDLLIYKLQNTAYKFSFLLVPISAPFVWLMFAWRRGFRLYDHVVFSLYSLSFMSMLFIVITLLNRVSDYVSIPDNVWLALFFAPVVHISTNGSAAAITAGASALWRTGYVTMVMAPLCITLFIAAIFLLGALG